MIAPEYETVQAALALRMKQTAWLYKIAEARAAEARAVEHRTSPTSPGLGVSAGGSSGGGDCYGGPVPDHIVDRESRGDPHAVNASSGAFGCYQIMPAWWSGRCSHLDRYSVSDQQACAQIILDTQGPSAWRL